MWDLSLVDPKSKLPHKDATLSLFGNATYVSPAKDPREQRNIHIYVRRLIHTFHPFALSFLPLADCVYISSIDLPSPSTSHLLITLRSGETIFLDLARQCHLSPYRIPNVWQLHEDRLRRSGLQTRRRHGPYVMLSSPTIIVLSVFFST